MWKSMEAHPSSQQSRRLRKAASSSQTSRSCKSTRFNAAEDRLLNQLKTSGELTRKEIHRRAGSSKEFSFRVYVSGLLPTVWDIIAALDFARH